MWKKFSIFNIFMKEFVTLSISLTIVCLLVVMFWLFYSLPLWIVWNYVITPIFNSDTLTLFESFMMMMGFASGMMMGNMLGMNHMMMGDFMANVDYANGMGYADGAGFGDGALPAEGGDFGGDGGGFMDGGMAVGF